MKFQRKNKEYKFYKELYKHLLDKNLGFCFLVNGELRSREDCIKKLSKYEYIEA